MEVKENKMGVMPINKLIVSMSLPIMISMLVQAMYNIVDSIFVSKVAEEALSAVSLAFPVQNLMIAIAVGTGVGVNALLSRSLGEKNLELANKTAVNGVFLAILSYLLFLIFGVFFVKTFFEIQTEDATILKYAIEYTSIVTVASFGLFGQIIFERLLQSTGRTFYTMLTQGLGAIINIILDPILIFGLLGMPKLGIAGAAIATVIGQTCALVLAIIFNIKCNKEIELNVKKYKIDGDTIKKIYAVGLPSILMQSISSVMTFAVNNILMGFVSTATACFGVYFKLQSFIFMPVFGLNNGMVPIIAYNYGARNEERVMKTLKTGATYAVAIMLIGFIIFQAMPGKLLMMFDASETMLGIGIPMMRIISISFLVAGFCIVCITAFQALGNGMLSLIASAARQLIVLVPCAYLLSLTGEVSNVWWAFPIAEIVSVVLCFVFMKVVVKKELAPLKNLENKQIS